MGGFRCKEVAVDDSEAGGIAIPIAVDEVRTTCCRIGLPRAGCGVNTWTGAYCKATVSGRGALLLRRTGANNLPPGPVHK